VEIPLLHRRGQAHPWRVELDALAKAVGGAMLFGMPLLFTMEMWWVGEVMSHVQLLVFLALTFLANVGLARMSGFRPEANSWRLDVLEALEAMGVGVLLSVVTLFALGRIDSGPSPEVMLGIVGVQVIPLSLGATVGNLVFDPSVGRASSSKGSSKRSPLHELLNDVGATIAGALFLGFSIAPTGEIPMLASGLNLWNVLAIVALTMLASYVIVFASGFDPTHRSQQVGGLFQRPFSETMLAYVLALGASLALLYGFGQASLSDPFHWTLMQTLALGVPASIGGAAGRVVV
jgi:putative integral membrane protein (TIGR02587 family)